MFEQLSNPLTALSVILVGTLVLYLLLSFLIHSLERIRHSAVSPLRLLRNFALPLALIMAMLVFFLNQSSAGIYFRAAETGLFCLLIWIVPSLVKELLFRNSGSHTSQWRAAFPELFFDLLRFTLLAVGASFVFSIVWGSDLGGFFATLGVGSIVIGLALQDTLGNLIAGIALLFERPFALGDWIKIGDSVGMVREMNWRAVHLFTLEENVMIVPNSEVAKQPIKNFNRPGREHEVELKIAFSYNDPPNKVKQILCQVAARTDGIIKEDILARTLSYDAYSITYEIRFFIPDFGQIEEVNEAFMTQIWYAAKRNGLTIPFPIQSIYMTDVPYQPPVDYRTDCLKEIKQVDIFSELTSDELQSLAADAVVIDFAANEIVFDQGDPGDSLYIVRSGQARISITNNSASIQEVARLGVGQFFGEMALLTGEPRSATVSAVEDLEIISVSKAALEPILHNRPEVVESIAEIIASRRRNTQEIRSQAIESAAMIDSGRSSRNELLKNIYNFFSLTLARPAV